MYGCDGDIPADKVGMKLSSSSLAKDHQNWLPIPRLWASYIPPSSIEHRLYFECFSCSLVLQFWHAMWYTCTMNPIYNWLNQSSVHGTIYTYFHHIVTAKVAIEIKLHLNDLNMLSVVFQDDTVDACELRNAHCNKMLHIWSLGMEPFCQPDYKAFRFGKGLTTWVSIQLHWNNPHKVSTYTGKLIVQ